MKHKKPEYISKTDALKKLQRYCAYQDRCHQEVRRKLLDLGVYGDELEEVMAELVEEKFLNEERFARSYARGKFRMKKWGWIRIQKELKQREISVYCIRKAREEIEEDAYHRTLREVLEKRFRNKSGFRNDYERIQDLIKYGFSRGFETNLVVPVANQIVKGVN
ncbi:MAG: RecX family transcriptional regulator [Bacteroidetes bacterium]|nr:RecX family transcriptional regulator [Bacteroidota bacterium]